MHNKINLYCAVGDSITDRLVAEDCILYHDWLRTWLHPVNFLNMGISGSTVAKEFDCMAQRVQNIPKNADLITVYAGINDFGRNQPLGQLGDTTPETFYGALTSLVSTLCVEHAEANCYFISHVHIGNDFFSDTNIFGLHQIDYENAIEKVTSSFGIPHLSLYRNGGLNFFTPRMKQLYSVDSLHPNNYGHYKIAQKIYNFINNQQDLD